MEAKVVKVEPNNKTAKKEEQGDEIRDYEQCGCQIGCGKCTTKRLTMRWLNVFNSPQSVLVFLSLVAFVHGFVINGMLNTVITTLEKRFRLSSSESGFIVSIYDIAMCLSLLFVTYVGGRGHKPQWLGWGLIMMSIGSILFALPHFIAPAYVVDTDYNCVDTSILCFDSTIRVYRGFFIAGQLMHGFGATPIFTLAITYLDENVKQAHSAIYHAIFYALAVIGSGIGFIVGAEFLKTFTNTDAGTTITALSPLWVGKWWAGFLIGAGCFFVLALPILMFPKQFPNTDKVRLEREKELHQSVAQLDIKGDEHFGKSLRDWPRCLWILLRNPTIIFISLGAAMDNGIITGIGPFGPKYIKTMFALSASDAAFYLGLSSIVASVFGQLVGGIVVSKMKLSVRRMLLMCVISSVLALACFLIFVFQCENPKIAGYTVPFNGLSTVDCDSSQHCGCSTDYYFPVCGSDNLTYASYCEAACGGGFNAQTRLFVGCFRVSPLNPALGTASIEKCQSAGCSNFALFMVFIALAIFFLTVSVQPQIQSSLRSVPFYQRTFAIGIQWMFLRLLGSVPLPLIMGAVVDSACALWTNVCGECAYCSAYNERDLSISLLVVICVVKFLSIIFYLIAWRVYKPPPDEKKDKSEQN